MEWKDTLSKVEAIAKHAGVIVRRHFKKPPENTFKGDVDLVTKADKAAEKYIFKALKDAYPDYSIIGEEGTNYSPGKGATDYYWYFDPLDGTTNFVHRLPIFSVSIALAGIDRHPVLGVVYDPMNNECFTAIKGEGAFLNGKKITVSKTDELTKALVVTGFPYDVRSSPDNNFKEFHAMMLRAQGVRRLGSAALDLCYVAAGRFDGYWEQKLYLWDCLAGILMVEEASGKVTDYRESERLLYQTRPQVLATNGLIDNQMSAVLVTAR